jgi:hypothetical protein
MSGGAVLRASLLLGAMVALSACGRQARLDVSNVGDDGINAYPSNYKSEILSAMHAYLNDPTGIRDAVIAEPVLKPAGTGGTTRYVACLKFNPKKNATEYAGAKEIAAIFLAGRFDQFNETPRDQCVGAAYGAFPELQKLPP